MIGRRLAVVLLAILGAIAAVTVAAVNATSNLVTRTLTGEDGHRRAYHGDALVRFDGAGPERWANRARALHRRLLEQHLETVELQLQLRRERRILLSSPSIVEAINLACATYGQCDTLWRKARCETGGTFNSRAFNSGSGASGLFQFVGSTWNSTPYRAFSVWSPYANALAAGWMHDRGRGGEWSCR